ncbi:MAG: hypothetical protein IJU78_06840 [Clostridia bacterium]|nr:hypothetical protein [Clostridia bacterium]
MSGTPIDELVSTLYEMVEDARSMPLGNGRCVLDRDKVLDILDEIRANLPSDLKMAREIVDKRNEVIAAGKREYESLKKQADDYAKQKVNDNEITAQARQRAAELVAAAESRSREIMRVANEYCDDAMKRTEAAVSKTLDELRQSRTQFKAAMREQDKQQ